MLEASPWCFTHSVGVRGGAVYQVEVSSFSSRTKLINRDALVFIRKCPGLDIAGLLRLLPPHLLPNTRQDSSATGDNTLCTICSIRLRNSRHMRRFRTVPLCTHTFRRSEFIMKFLSTHVLVCSWLTHVHWCLFIHVHLTCFHFYVWRGHLVSSVWWVLKRSHPPVFPRVSRLSLFCERIPAWYISLPLGWWQVRCT